MKSVLKDSEQGKQGVETGWKPKALTADEALSLYIDANLTVEQYNLIRKVAIQQNADIFPSYKLLLQAKKRCYTVDVTVTDSSAECNF